ncbi:MAG: hypothetical protein LBL84_00015 [Candidatus Nomurabacteria bacterium]|jgi:hypothetical protein|nr:hypothetical protein [Candidatus Nomurabacteria bacterium]
MNDEQNQVPNGGIQPPADQPIAPEAPVEAVATPAPEPAPVAPEPDLVAPTPPIIDPAAAAAPDFATQPTPDLTPAPTPVSDIAATLAVESQQLATDDIPPAPAPDIALNDAPVGPPIAPFDATPQQDAAPVAPVEPAPAGMAVPPAPIAPETPQPIAPAGPIGSTPLQGAPQTNPTPAYNLPGNKPKTGLIIGIVVAAIVVIGGILAAVLILPSLNSKTLACSLSQTMSGISVDVKTNISFTGDTPQSIDMDVTYTYSSESEAKKYFDADIKSQIESSITSSSGGQGVDYEVSEPKLDGKTISVSVKASRDSANKVLTGIGLNSEKVTIDDVKKNYEKMGYTCKI